MPKVKVREGQQLANPEGGVHAAGETVDLGDADARDAVRSGVAEDVDGAFDDEDWAKAQKAAAEAQADETAAADQARQQVADAQEAAAGAEGNVASAKRSASSGGSGSSRAKS